MKNVVLEQLTLVDTNKKATEEYTVTDEVLKLLKEIKEEEKCTENL